jgi:glycosyltransferase involved in cell wall biosynthesis
MLPGILLINRNAVMGGVERVMLTCMHEARKHGFRPVLACPDNGPFPEVAREQGFDVEVCKFDWMQRTLNPRRLAGYAFGVRREGAHVTRICRDYDISLLHPHGPVSALYAVDAARKLGLPVLYHVHDAQTPNRFIRFAMQYSIPVLTSIVCVSETSRRVAESLGIPPSDIQVIYNGVSQKFLELRPEPATEVTGPGPHIGIVGLIVGWKGQHVFLRAAERILKQYPTAHFWVVGPLCHPDDQPYLDRLHKMADHPPLKGHVTFTGERNDIPRWMTAMDVMVMASVKAEALPTVVLEALALGRKLVATNIGGQLEIIRDGETGLFVPPEDPDAMASAVNELLSAPPGDQMGERAAADIRVRFTPDRFGTDLAAVYSELIGQAAPVSA